MSLFYKDDYVTGNSPQLGEVQINPQSIHPMAYRLCIYLTYVYEPYRYAPRLELKKEAAVNRSMKKTQLLFSKESGVSLDTTLEKR